MALGHRFQHLALARGRGVSEPSGEFLRRVRSDGDDLGVERRTARSNPFQRVEELVDPADPVLEQMAEPARTPGRQFGAYDSSTYRESNSTGSPGICARLDRRAQALVTEAGRHAHIEHGGVGTVLQERGQDRGPRAGDGHDLVPSRRQQEDEPLPQQGVVLGDHDSHGGSASAAATARGGALPGHRRRGPQHTHSALRASAVARASPAR